MALNQNAHKRNMQLMNEELQRLRKNQQKYDITPQKAVDYAKTANNLANQAGNGLDKLGQLTNNEKISNIGQKIANNTGSNLKGNVFNFAKDKIGSLMSKPTANPSIGNAVSNVAPKATTSLPTAISSAAPTTAGAGTLAGAGSATSGSALTSALTGATSAGTAAGTGAGTAAGTSALTSAIGAAAPSAAATTAGLGAGAGAAGAGAAGAGTTAAAAGMSAIPVAGWIAAAALMAYQLGSSIYKKKKAEAHQKSQKAAAESTQASLEGMNEIKQKIAEKQAQQKQAFADNPINGQLGDEQQVPMAKPSFEEMAQAVQPTQPVPETVEPPMTEQPVEQPSVLDTVSNVASDVVPQDGQFTGGAAPIDDKVPSVKYSKYYVPNTEISPLYKMPEKSADNLPKLPEKQNALSIGDILSDFIYKREQTYGGTSKPRKLHDWEIEEQNKKTYENFTPEQRARYDEAIAGQKASEDFIKNTIAKNIEAQKQVPQSQGLTDSTIPALPNVAPSQTQNIGTNGTLAGQTPQFEIIEPPTGTAVPTEQTTAQPKEVAEQTAQGQPAVQNPTIYQEPKTKQDIIANIFSKAKMGYDENSMNGFNPENVIAKEYEANVQDKDGNIKKENIKKDIWNRVGEAIGTGKRVLSNPLAQGGIAGLIYKATGGDTGESIKYGVDWAQDKAKSDYYQKQIDPNAKPNVFGGRYTAEDWKNKANIELAKAQQATAQAKLEQTDAYNKIRIQKMLHDMQSKPVLTEDNSFNNTVKAILSNANITATRKIEALTNALRDYSLLGKDQAAYAKTLAELYGIDLALEV